MSISARTLVDLILLGPAGDRRQLQDSPVLGDVWLKFTALPASRNDLLITPSRSSPAGKVAMAIARELRALDIDDTDQSESLVAYLQGLVAARLTFPELLLVIVPKTQWWKSHDVQEKLDSHAAQERLNKNLLQILRWAAEENEEKKNNFAQEIAKFSALDRYVALAGIILWMAKLPEKERTPDQLATLKDPGEITSLLHEIFAGMLKSGASAKKGKSKSKEGRPYEGTIWQVSLNRKAMPALERSVPAVKGDAVRTLFTVKCDRIRWAILDSGIDGNHEAFTTQDGDLRIVAAYDFRHIRKIVSLDNEHMGNGNKELDARLTELIKGRKGLTRAEAIKDLKSLAADAENDRPIHWELVEKFIEIDPKTPPDSPHGTHVAGIVGARDVNGEWGGLCQDIQLYDFRVLGKTLEDTEFAIIAALQFIRYMNERSGFMAVHGANLSLSIPHNVRNFACGSTPICTECERLVGSGVVVVAAAGNLGYHSFETKDGAFDGYAAFSITDPGNAEEVITVGSTHRFRPHTYGVSFFSSRGPTGDGRLKPDIVAPGERIRSCVLDNNWGELDGTSMAAPHVSGAAAMLMARYSELIGQPRKVKRILCETATDLGRERSFQGHGMLDILRAFQKI